MPRSGTFATLLRAVLLTAVLSLLSAGGALASTSQVSIFQDDPNITGNTAGTLQRLRLLGAEQIRVFVRWQSIAPSANSHRRPAHFNALNPAAYPSRNWTSLDTVVRTAKQDGIVVIFDVIGGAPLWATGPGAPTGTHYNWEPSGHEYGQFVHAVATRYSGSYDPIRKQVRPGSPNDLPSVTAWSIWNEADYGPSLAPQGVPGNLTVDFAPRMYRALLDAGWSALHETGHGRDLILFGELAPRGSNYWGVFSGMKPLVFLRSLYCVDSRYRALRGAAAQIRGCPTSAAGTRAFTRAHPALFGVGGFANHPYMRWYQPNKEAQPDPDYSTLGEIGNLERALDSLQRVYGSQKKLPIYDTEFGYITTPPKHDNQLEPGNNRFPWVSQTTAANYLNWAEYIHWRDPRLQSYDQYLLYDPLPSLKSNDWGGFASGLINNGPRQIPKPTYYAWRLPLYMPVTSVRRNGSLEVWGCVRPARYALLDGDGPQAAQVQFAPGSSLTFTTIASIPIPDASNCYFDTHLHFPGSGTVRLIWQYPASDPLLGGFGPAQSRTIFSRHVQITVH